MPPLPHSSEGSFKKMRKGTRSCKECRRRKIRCIYRDEHSHFCDDCALHRRQCVPQGQVATSIGSALSSKQSVRVRVTKLESIVERLSKKKIRDPAAHIRDAQDGGRQQATGILAPNRNYTMDDLAELDLQSQARSPLLTLFDNDMLKKSDGESTIPVNTFSKISFGAVDVSDREKLLSTISTDPNTSDINKVGGGWWLAWQDFYPGLKDMEIARSLNDYVEYHLSQEQPAMVAVGLLCLAMSLQHIRAGIDDNDLHLSTSPHDLMLRILAAVDEVVLIHDEYLPCRAGLTALIMRAKIHAESNQLRKSWLRIRQAILVGQKSSYAAPQSDISMKEINDRQRFMGGLFETDRLLSLVLGLPYAVDDNFTDRLASLVLQSQPDLDMRMRALRRVTCIAAGHVSDRNADMEASSFQRTNSIQEGLSVAAAAMPESWWDIATHLNNLASPQESHEHLMTQLWFYQVQSLLHLPFMLKASSEPEYEENSGVCLSSNRMLLRLFNVMSQDPSLAAYMCKCEAFQALLAALMLLVGLLQYSTRNIEPTGSTFADDMGLIDITKDIFRFGSQQQGGSIAKQGLRILESLSAFLEDDEGDSDREQMGSREVSLFVPYFGTISVKSASKPRRKQLSPDIANSIVQSPEDSPGVAALSALEYDSIAAGLEYSPFDESSYQFQTLPTNPYSQHNTTYSFDNIMLGAELDQSWEEIFGNSSDIENTITNYHPVPNTWANLSR